MATKYAEYKQGLAKYMGEALIIWPVNFDQCFNGNFATCPNCGRTMAKNACGYWSCIMGCGLNVREPKHTTCCSN